MGFFSWLFNKPPKNVAKRTHKKKGKGYSTKERNLRNQLRQQGINPDLALCTECGEWYNVRNQAAVDRHAH